MNVNPNFVPTVAARSRPSRGFALVIVLVILSLLAVITVGYLSSMASERATASAFSNRTRAEQAAQAGVDTAVGILRDYFKAYPDSATAWDTTQATGTDGAGNAVTTEGTTLYLKAMPGNDANSPDPTLGTASTDANFPKGNNPNNVDGTGTDKRQTFALPLISGATVKLAQNKASAVSTLTTDTTAGPGSINLNSRRQIGDADGWIGTPPNYTNKAYAGYPKPVTVPWVEITQKDGYSGNAPPVVSRYAFWVEDESFRANVNFARLGDGNNDVRRDNTMDTVPPATPAPLDPRNADLLGLLKTIPGASPLADATGLFHTRLAYPEQVFPDARAFGHTGQLTGDAPMSANTVNKLRYLTTTQSASLNVSRHGTQRLNLNKLIPQTDVPADVATTKNQIDAIIQTIQFHAPNFHQRFFRSGAGVDAGTLNAMQVPDDTHKYPLIYLNKVAANIRDYIDKDPVPTIIASGGAIKTGKPEHAFAATSGSSDGPNEIWAQGKDSAPFIEECAARYRGGHLDTDPSRFHVAIDHYVEVWNSSNQDVLATDLGKHPVIRVANPTQWISTSPADPRLTNTDAGPAVASPYDSRIKPALRDYDIDISNVKFKAGVATVITTDPDYKQIITDTNAQANVYVCGFYPAAPDPNAVGKRIFNGKLPFLSDGKTYAAGLKMVFGDSSGGTGFTGGSDYETEIVLGTEDRTIDCIEGGLPVFYNSGATLFLTDATPSDETKPMAAKLPLMGGSLHGNSSTGYPGVTGDPRSNNEQLEYKLYKGSDADSTRYFNANGAFTLGYPNYNFVIPEGSSVPWPDYYKFPSGNQMTANSVPYVIANAELTSIGQLGDIYDPLRVGGTGAYIYARGGGRTFKIGQHDDRWDGNTGSASRSWASWRLVDFFGVSNLMDQPGLININGVGRDNGAALRAALYGLSYQPKTSGISDVQPASQALNVDSTDITQPGLQAMIEQIKSRLATPLSFTYSKPTQPTPPAAQLFVGAATDNTGAGPFFERGELGELPAFGRDVAVKLVGGVNMGKVLDRGREELFRRLVEMTTTRGSVFTVYALGQSINNVNDPKKKIVTGTQQVRVTFKLIPKQSDGGSFYPASVDGAVPFDAAARFTKPDHYDVQILSASSGNG